MHIGKEQSAAGFRRRNLCFGLPRQSPTPFRAMLSNFRNPKGSTQGGEPFADRNPGQLLQERNLSIVDDNRYLGMRLHGVHIAQRGGFRTQMIENDQ